MWQHWPWQRGLVMKKTPLYLEHQRLKAVMVPFGGYMMPVQYSNVIEEHNAVRKYAGIFDVSHMGEFFVRGWDAAKFLNFILTNDVGRLASQKAFYTCMCNRSGGVVDDLFVYKMSDDEFMLVVNAGTAEKDLDWIRKHSSGFTFDLEDAGSETGKIDVQGPMSEKILAAMFDDDFAGIKRFCFIRLEYEGNLLTISRTGYTGEDGFEIYCPAQLTPKIWNEMIEKGKVNGLKPCGLGARDTLRLEACYSLYGHEIDEDITPYEAGIGFVVRPDKGDFIGRDALMENRGNLRARSIALEMADRAVPRQGYAVVRNDVEIGKVTSGTFSPTLKKGIALASVSAEIKAGEEIGVMIRNKTYKARAVVKPFYAYRGGNIRL